MKYKNRKIHLSESNNPDDDIYIFFPKGMDVGDIPFNLEAMLEAFKETVVPKIKRIDGCDYTPDLTKKNFSFKQSSK